MLESYKHYYNTLNKSGKFRSLATTTQPLLDFSSNDYLGFSQLNSLLEAATKAGKQYGVGSTGSRLLSGNFDLFNQLENQIAVDKKSESALILNSGFQANLTVLASLLDQQVLGHKPLVFFDKLNHSSLYQAVYLSGAELIRYQHNDINHLTQLLKKFEEDSRSKFIVSETLFGMDGDIAPLEQIITLANQHHAFLYLDEAHATGIMGPHGYGLSTTMNLEHLPHVVMGTFSKALGCFGAYIACQEITKKYIINKCSGFIYATSLSPMMIGAATKGWELVKGMGKDRENLLHKSSQLRTNLKQLGFNTLHSESHIIPLIFGDEKSTMDAKQQLLHQEILVSAVRPPSVPPGTSRLRLALTVKHSVEDVKQLIDALRKL